MPRNYNAIHYIRDNLKAFNPDFVETVVRCFNYIDSEKEPDGCLSNSAILYIMAKKCGYEPELCYGLCVLQGNEFYHAWLEINNIVIDIAVYGNVNFSPFSIWDDISFTTPYIGSYEDSPIQYGKYCFDDDWKYAQIHGVVGKTLEQYMDGLKQNLMWKLACRILNLSPTRQTVDDLRKYCKDMVFDRG